MPVGRPFDNGKVTNTSGAWQWVGLPQSVLLNGNAFYGDCKLQPFGGNATIPCNVTTLTVPPNESTQQPAATSFNPGMATLSQRGLGCWRFKVQGFR